MTSLAISLGDPAGIGPELIAQAWVRRGLEKLQPFFVVGGSEILAAAAMMRGLDVPVVRVTDPQQAASAFPDGLPVLDLPAMAGSGADPSQASYQPGKPSPDGARLAFASLRHATQLAKEGKATAVVTAPVAKSELAKVGFKYPGQTEFLAASCNIAAENAVMMLAGPQLRTVPLTVHCALSEVASLLSVNLIRRRARITADALTRDFGIISPRLAVAGLNPHAGENGQFGDEEIRIIAPAIAALREDGIDATGPHPADAMFAPHSRQKYDVALAMYHDQALIPLKALDFDSGVNVTLGLPIIRTSPDHGTAFDIAGTGKADAGAMIAAIRMAGECAARRGQ